MKLLYGKFYPVVCPLPSEKQERSGQNYGFLEECLIESFSLKNIIFPEMQIDVHENPIGILVFGL